MTMILFSKIIRMYLRDQLSINEIVKWTSLFRNTDKKWVRMLSGSDPKYHRRSQLTNLSHYEDQLKQALFSNSYLPKLER